MGLVIGKSRSDSGGAKPFFSLAVTTYDRTELLRDCLQSIIDQSFVDFEILVGNDNQSRHLLLESLGVADHRIRVFNWEQNLGELGNMNALVANSRGHYLTWIADDDLYAPEFLQSIYTAILEHNSPACIFTGFTVLRGAEPPQAAQNVMGQTTALPGSEFLSSYFSGAIKTMSFNGMYRLDALMEIGLPEPLSDTPVGILAEYWLLVRCGLLREIVYVNTPLVYFRAHDDSYSTQNREVQNYKTAGYNLVRKSLPLLTKPPLDQDIYRNLLGTLRIAASVAVIVSSRTKRVIPLRELREYFASLTELVVPYTSNGTRKQMRAAIFMARVWLFLWLWPLGACRALAPRWLAGIGLKVRSIILGEK